MKKKQTLQAYFDEARQDVHPSPVTSVADLESRIQLRKSRRGIGVVLHASSIIALLIGAWYISQSPDLPTSTTSTASTTRTTSTELSVGSTANVPADHPESVATVESTRDARSTRRKHTVVVVKTTTSTNVYTTDDDHNVTSMSDDDYIHVAALLANDDVFRSLNIEPSAVTEICRNLAGADSLTNCSVGANNKVTVCVFRDGTPDEVTFMDGPGPIPVMFTSASGRGRVVTSRYSNSVDPNTLVPVAAHGCGDNVLMWFRPNEEFLYSLPDSLGRDLNAILEFDMQTNPDGKGLRIRRKQMLNDSVATREEIISLDSLADSAFGVYRRLLDSLGLKLRNDDIVEPQKQRLSSPQRFNQQVLVIKCGLTDKKSRLPVPTLPIQETRMSDGGILNTKLYPNPTTDGGVTFGYSLSEPRLLTITLVDLAGNVIRELASSVWKNSGSGQMAFTIPDVPAGMYLITVMTDKNERVVQRLIVQ